MIELVLGGARSGKSRYAEQQAADCGLNVVYVATAQAGDDEMASRIQHHRQRRPAHWLTVEQPEALADVIQLHANHDTCVLIDCLTLWLSNVLFGLGGELTIERYQQQRDHLFDALRQHRQRIVMVSNEVGLGVVAADAL
ncbi:MAG: bifunctional adenosylcobinamide kinase/adenosylcobinamide-phosphate guanylyltransferase, partial [Methylomonas sp.]